MNAAETQNVAGTDAPAVLEPGTDESTTTPADFSTFDGIALAIAETGEAVRLAEEGDAREAVVSLIGRIRTTGAVWAKHGVDMLRLRKDLAQMAVELMPFVLLSTSGKPDWDGTSKSFKVLFDEQLKTLLDEKGTAQNKLTNGDKNKLINSVRQHIKRTYLDPAIRAWVYLNIEGVAATMPNGRKADGTYVDHDSELFKHEVKREYVRCDIAVPDRYLSPEEVQAKADKRGGGGPGPGSDDPAEVIRRSMAGMAGLAPHWGAAELLQGTTALAAVITDLKSGRTVNPITADLLQRVSLISEYLYRLVDNPSATKGPEDEGITDLYWTEADAEKVASV